MKPTFVSKEQATKIVALIGAEYAARFFSTFYCVREFTINFHGKEVKTFAMWAEQELEVLPKCTVDRDWAFEWLGDHYAMPDMGCRIPCIWHDLLDMVNQFGYRAVLAVLNIAKIDYKITLVDTTTGKNRRLPITSETAFELLLDCVRDFRALSNEEREALYEAERIKHLKSRKATATDIKFIKNIDEAIANGKCVPIQSLYCYDYIKENKQF